ncbi:NAD(P)H-binding protein [Streptoalloteichus tenebrarius]|uniref:NAD(P)H-binding protein n=1 Tax=Streptoalloteichus tenebrarius (strain ATCC 17920 / DSM 40477 / JCM 4838 / CBS 697.72 / NBRC 16177 / NCIMB 11028 / NRRL B-12390 / A12253. 1 / ISP 5477) TaxID=1933 RepID=UPI0020A6054E|nr:NAD(P)H-binding protein [Streptoalloteichus tenebrarius]
MTTRGHEFLVLGATGKTGRRVVRRLRAAGETVRAASRSGEVRFDWADRASWSAALNGVSAVYLVAPDDPAPVRDFVDEAVTAGVGRFVVLSGRGIDHIGPGFGEGMIEAERAVRASGVEWTIIRPNNFDQNFDEDLWHAPLREGRLALPIGEVPEPFVDVEDVAEVAATLLTADGHAGRTYELSGPRGLTFGEVVDQVAAATGRVIRFESLTLPEYRAELLAAGVPEAGATALCAMFALHQTGVTSEPVDGVRSVLGREPATFEAYVARVAATGAWS